MSQLCISRNNWGRRIGRVWDLSRSAIMKLVMLAALLVANHPAPAQPRALGLDISAWQGNISQTTWNNIYSVENRQFVILRSSRGGTTGYYNQNDASNSQGLNTLSQRYDDPYFIQNINRATAAGMFAGSYHFSRPEIIETTLNSGGIRNSGTDEADHFMQMAGPWMRPGYLLPVHDLESGDGIRTDDEMAQFCLDFSSRIYAVMGIRPAIYINGNYAAFVVGGASASLRNQIAQPSGSPPNLAAPAYPTLWSARWPNQADPNSIDVQNGEPKDSYAAIYGPWDDYGVTHPWTFWQYASTGRLPSYNNGGSNLDLDVARGGLEFLKDQLVPAIWLNDSDGQWTTLANWNSGQPPMAPVAGPGQVPPVGTLTLPTPRLPGAAGSGVTSGQNDTVILDRPNTNITVTLASGTHNIRKLYVREALNITGGSLTVNYVPSPDSTTNAAQFSGAVTLSGGSLSLHTLQVDATRTFTLSGGALTFNTINLMPNAAAPAKLLVNGDATFSSFTNTTATIGKGAGAGSSGLIDLAGGNRSWNVANGPAEVDLSVEVPVINGALTKTGPGTLRITGVNAYAGGTVIGAGRLLVNNSTGSGTGSGGVTVDGGILGGTGTIAGVVTVNSGGTISPGTSSAIGKLTLNSAPALAGTILLRVDRNNGSSLADNIVLSSGALNYGGTLVITNVGATLVGGEVFTNFAAGAFSGAFTAINLPALAGGLNWHTDSLTANGTIKVNRHPVANPLSFTNHAPLVLEIPLASLTAAVIDADSDTISLTGINLTTTNGITLLTNNTFIYYSNYLSVADQFTYTADDGHGGSVTGAVQIASSPTGRFTSYPSGAGNPMTLNFAGRPGWTYYLERSTDLMNWTTISTNIAPASGVFEYADDFHDLSEPAATAFYRLRWMP